MPDALKPLPILPRGPLPHTHYAEVTRGHNAITGITGDEMITGEIAGGKLRLRWIGPRLTRTVFRGQITAIANDYLTVRYYDGTSTIATDVYVAKPRKLRHVYSYYEGLTSITTTNAQTLSATDGSTTETWKVTPSYVVGDDIQCEIAPQGTGVTVSSIPLIWVDSNLDARAWAVEA